MTSKELFSLFLTFFRIGLFTFGGGYAMIPQIQRELVDKRKWVDESYFVDSILVTQSVPGPVVVNLSIYLGYKFAGIAGVIACLLGVVLPSFFIILLIAVFLSRFAGLPIVEKIFLGIRPAVVGLIVYAAIKLSKNFQWSGKALILLLLSFSVNVFLGVSPVFIIVGAILIGVISFYYNKEKIPTKKTGKGSQTVKK